MKPRKFINFQFITYLVIIISVVAFSYSVKGKSGGKEDFLETPPKKEYGSLSFSMKLNNRYYYNDSKNNEIYLYLDIGAKNIERSTRRTPLNISVVIDRSGSMDEKNKLEFVKEAVNYIIDELDNDDYLSVITYDDDVDVLLRSGLVEGKYLIKDKVSNLKAGGYTNLSAGMLEGYEQVKYSYRNGYVNRVLLLSDGIANKGITDVRRLQDIVQQQNRREGIVISTFGVGNDFNEDLMGNIAEYGSGNYYYIGSPESIPRIFASELNNIRSLAAQNTKIRIKYPSEYMRLSKGFGYPYEIEGNEIVIDLKDVFASETKSILLKFEPFTTLRNNVSFTATLEYNDVEADFRKVRTEEYASLNLTSRESEYESGFDTEVKTNIAMFEANDLMQQALYEADKGNYEEARRKLDSGKEYLNNQGADVKASDEVKEQINSMEKYEGDLESAPSMSTEEKSEMQKEGKYDNYKVKKKKK